MHTHMEGKEGERTCTVNLGSRIL